MNLTAQTVATLKLNPGEADKFWFDDAIPGFGIRIRANGTRTWVYQYKIGAKQRRMSLGSASAIKPTQARAIASELYAKRKLGGDPAAERHVKVERAQHTFGSLTAKYLDYQKRSMRERSYKQISRHLEAHAAALHKLPIDSIDQRTIADRLSGVEKASGSVTANRVRATMSAMFSWGMREGLASVNPVANTNKRAERPRDRVLKDAELRLIWRALNGGQYATIIKLLLLTAQRVSEITGLRWSEIDFDRGIISLPAERTKNARPHDIPMAPTLLALLKAQPKAGGRDLVFGRPGGGPFSGLSRCKERLDARIAELNNGLPLASWVHHDLRRSAATGMADIGIQPHIIEAVLNHVSGHKGGIAGIYNRATYGAEKAQALARWDEHLRAVVCGVRS
jgi:integrase